MLKTETLRRIRVLASLTPAERRALAARDLTDWAAAAAVLLAIAVVVVAGLLG